MTIHHFEPTYYHITFGSHEPVLCIGCGDTVITTTVDVSGHDARSEQVTEGGNPQTGPFYVDGAEPGDTLAVHLDRFYPIGGSHGHCCRNRERPNGARDRDRLQHGRG